MSLRPFFLPNELSQLPRALLALRAKSSGHPWQLLASQARLPEVRKDVFPDFRFVGELKSLLVGF
ncbi:MAG: hypothetical protein DME31_00270 [Verrucomicrobia bacterium]|nr:MAG: hypothetical protein DMC59_03645 [Verrucomicrobiota bacterium]PYL05431.1 MAG: hypothetical protein DME31_00270 [Verrucomicrobiota bacterium]PYL32146.1 MAG: hypothetical protein DMF39_00190 [Verrucomicrobiota bacterium]